LGWRSDVAIRCQESGRSFRSNAYSLLEGLSNAAYLYFLPWGRPKRDAVQDCVVRCVHTHQSVFCPMWLVLAALTVQYSTYDVQYRYPIGQPVQQSQEPPTIPLGSMHLLTHASEVPVPRQLRSLHYRIQMGLTSILVMLAAFQTRLKIGRWKICRYARLVPRVCFQLPRSRLFSCLDNHLVSVGFGALSTRDHSPYCFF
jgi:hypothetical protein